MSLLALVGGCYLPLDVGQQMQADLTALRHELHDARRACDTQAGELQASTQKLQSQLAAATKDLDAVGQGARSADADMGSQLESVMRAIEELRGTVEVTEHRLGQTETKLTESAALAQAKAAEDAAKARAQAQQAAQFPRKKADQLAEAQRLLKSGKKAEAQTMWREIIRRTPQELGVTDTALLRLADSLYAERQYDPALREYVRIVDGFSKSPHVEAAYFQIGLSSLALGRLEDAQTFLGEVVRTYPKSSRMKEAQAKLADIAKRLEAGKQASKSTKK